MRFSWPVSRLQYTPFWLGWWVVGGAFVMEGMRGRGREIGDRGDKIYSKTNRWTARLPDCPTTNTHARRQARTLLVEAVVDLQSEQAQWAEVGPPAVQGVGGLEALQGVVRLAAVGGPPVVYYLAPHDPMCVGSVCVWGG